MHRYAYIRQEKAKTTMKKETVIIGDIHGCIDELKELLATIQYDPRIIRLVFVNDLLDRGPDPIGTIRLVQELCKNGAECVLSNHEWKHLQYHNNEKRKALTGQPNNMRPLGAQSLAAHKQLTDEDFDWIRKLPLTVDLGNDWHCLHAGLEPAFDFANQRPDKIIRCRYVDKETGKSKSMGPQFSQPENSVFWADAWNGKENIVFGHSVFWEAPMVFRNENNTCIGIDGGCVYGGNLIGYFLERQEAVKIKAKREYYTLKHRNVEG